VEQLMDAPFPVVDGNTPVDEIAKHINKENRAVLVADNNSYHIITMHDIIQTLH
jgi:cystathionine beta-synthase